MAQKHENKNQEAGTGGADHLGYLLTAYLFDNLSPAGKAEVESHLAVCDDCRDQLELLRATLGLTEKAFEDDGKTYVFEARRRQRILDAAARARHGFFDRLNPPALTFRSWKAMAAVAALLLLVVSVAFSAMLSSGSKTAMLFEEKSAGNAPRGSQDDTLVMVNELKAAPEESSPAKEASIARLRPASPSADREELGRALNAESAAAAPKAEPSTSNFTAATTTVEFKPSDPNDPRTRSFTWTEKVEPPAKPAEPAGVSTTTLSPNATNAIRMHFGTPIQLKAEPKESTQGLSLPSVGLVIPNTAPTGQVAPPPPPAVAAFTAPQQPMTTPAPAAPVETMAYMFLPSTPADPGVGPKTPPARNLNINAGDTLGDLDAAGGGGDEGKAIAGVLPDRGLDNLLGRQSSTPAQNAPVRHIENGQRPDGVGYGLFPNGGGPGPAGTEKKPEETRPKVATVPEFDGANVGFGLTVEQRDRDLQKKTELPTVKNARDMQPGPKTEVTEDVRKYQEELQKIKGVVIKQQQAVVAEPNEPESHVQALQSGEEQEFLEAKRRVRGTVAVTEEKLDTLAREDRVTKLVEETGKKLEKFSESNLAQGDQEALAKLKQKVEESEREKIALERDLSRQTKRIEALVEKGVPVLSILSEDVTATQPVILSDPATAAARTGVAAKQEAEIRLEQLAAGQALTARPSVATKNQHVKEILEQTREEVSNFGLEGVVPEPAKKVLGQRNAQEALAAQNDYLEVQNAEASKNNAKQVQELSRQLKEAYTQTYNGRFVDQSKQDGEKAIEQLSEQTAVRNPPRSKKALAANADKVVVPADVLDKAELSDHFETINPDKPDTQSAFGNPDAKMFHRIPSAEDVPVQLGLKSDNVLDGSVRNLAERDLQRVNQSQATSGGAVAAEPIKPPAISTTDLLAIRDPNATKVEGTLYHRGKIEEEQSAKDIKYDQIAHQRRERAALEGLAARERESEQFKARVGKMVEEARQQVADGEFKAAEETAIKVLKIDPLNSDAESLKNKSRGISHRDERDRKANNIRDALLNVDEASVSKGSIITYPQNRDWSGKSADQKPPVGAIDYLSAFDGDIDNTVAGQKAAEINGKAVGDEGRMRAEGYYRQVPKGGAELAAETPQIQQDVAGNPQSKLKDGGTVELKINDVQDLTGYVADFPGPTLLRPRLETRFGSNVESNAEGQKSPSVRQRNFWGVTGKSVATENNLEKMIKERFADDFADPATSVDMAGGKLVIMNRPEVQKKIDAYLGELRKDPAGFRSEWYAKELSSPALMNNDVSRGQAERTLRGFMALREDAGTGKSLSFAEFCKRPAPVAPPVLTDDGLDEDAYIEKYGTRPFVDAKRDHLSTFSMDVDTASYTRARSQLRDNNLPDPAAVRVEEFVNYFKQPYTVAGDEAFGVFAEAAPSPFHSVPTPLEGVVRHERSEREVRGGSELQLLKIGIKSRDPKAGERKPAMLTFAIDTSGSMTRDDRLDLLRAALGALVEKLQPEDAVSIVAFSDQAQVVLPRTQARQKQRILDAVAALHSDGGTNVEAGLALAYRIADESFSPDAVNRVILCSDGVANVGAKGPEAVLKTVKVFAGRGIDLSSVGFGMGKYNDEMMMKLADNGNGSCHFVDNLDEARRIFTEQLPPNLSALSRDAKVQVEFNPSVVARYRLLGYEKRKIADKDFRNDAIDAGEVQHSTLVTALYEIERAPAARGPLGKVFLRWKDAGHRHLPVVERNFPLDESMQSATVDSASPQLRFLACVARFAELLRDSRWTRHSSYADVLEQLDRLPADFKQSADWKEVRELVQRAQTLSVQQWLKNL